MKIAPDAPVDDGGPLSVPPRLDSAATALVEVRPGALATLRPSSTS